MTFRPTSTLAQRGKASPSPTNPSHQPTFQNNTNRAPPSAAIIIPSYLGLVTGALPPMILGVAIAGALPNRPSWQEGYETNSVGGVMGAMLAPVGGFGKFLLVLMALSVLANVIGTVYALSLNLQALLYVARVRVPRIVYGVILTVIIIAVGIEVAAKFIDSLHNFLGIICYWPACYISVATLEHVLFRKGRADNYDLKGWDTAGRLPSGIAALGASVLSFALVVPGMDQLWFVGPIAKTTGDIGFEVAFAITAILYVPFRWLEIRIQGRV
ncbi:hypothetical protein IMZ48_35615 [Candidatus Bathyarchaeota archaeon]|nr:hypothetical protein [Candidatus Bathyarchaeota archaeon]